MSSTGEIDLLGAKTSLESIESTVEERVGRARRLCDVVARKRAERSHAAARDRATAARRLLEEADELLAEHDAHRQRLHEHVESNPQIEGGVYHGHVQTFDGLRGAVAELTRRIDLELALARYGHEAGTPRPGSGGTWEAPYDAVLEGLHLLTHVRSHDVPALVHAAEHRDGADDLQHPTDGFLSRLAVVRERADLVETIDHDEVARSAAAVNRELAADYRAMVGRFRDQHAALADDLTDLAARIAGSTGADRVSETGTGDAGGPWNRGPARRSDESPGRDP